MNETLGIIGILFTIFFGLPSAILIFRKGGSKIIYFQEELINLHDKISKNIPDLKITYKEETINEYIFLIRGYIFCQGKADITPEQIERSLNIKLPSGGKWHEQKVLSKTEGLRIKLNNEANKLNLDFGLFKNLEYVKFEGILETHEVDNLEKEIQISHRIANVGKAEKYTVEEYRNPIKRLLYILLLICGLSINYFIMLPLEVYNFNLTETYYKAGAIYEPAQGEYICNLTDYWDKVEEDYSYFDLIKSKQTKLYKIDSEFGIQFEMKTGSQIYMLGILTSINFYLLYLFLLNLIGFLNRRKILKIISQEEGGSNKY